MPPIAVETLHQAGIGLAGGLHAHPGQRQPIGKGGVHQRQSGGPGHRTGDVGHTVVDHTIHGKDGGGVGGGMGGLHTAALIHSHIHDDCAGLHKRKILPPDQLGGRAAGQEHGAHHQICLGDRPADVVPGAEEGGDLPGEDVVQIGQTLEVHIQNRDIAPQAHGHLAGVGAHVAAAQDDHIPPLHTGHTREEDAPAAVGLFQIFGPLLDGHASGDLAHGREAGKPAPVASDGLIGHGFHSGCQKGIRQGGLCRQVEIGEKDLIPAEQGIFSREGLTISWASAQTGAAPSRNSAPAWAYSSSGKPEPRPAPRSTST